MTQNPTPSAPRRIAGEVAAYMSAYHRSRDAHVLPMYELTTQLATLEPPPPPMQQLLGSLYGDQEGMDAFVSVVAGTMSPVELFDPARIEAAQSEIPTPVL